MRLTHVTEDAVTATAKVNENAMLYWALQYGQSVEILSPESLRERVRDVVRGMAKRYEKEEPGI